MEHFLLGYLYVFFPPKVVYSWYFPMKYWNGLFTHNCWLVHEVLDHNYFTDCLHKSYFSLAQFSTKPKQSGFLIPVAYLLPCQDDFSLSIVLFWFFSLHCFFVLLVCITHLKVSSSSYDFWSNLCAVILSEW